MGITIVCGKETDIPVTRFCLWVICLFEKSHQCDDAYCMPGILFVCSNS